MIRQELKLSKGQSVALEIEPKETLLYIKQTPGSRPYFIELTLKDLEELTDLMMDSFYKASQMENQIGEGVNND